MNDITETIKATTLSLVLQEMISGVSKKDACEKYGMSTITFDRSVAKYPEVFNEAIVTHKKLLDEQYSAVADKRLAVIKRIVEMPIDEMSIKDLVAFESYLSKLEQTLTTGVNVTEQNTPQADSAKAFIALLKQGAVLQQTKSEARIMLVDPDHENKDVIDV